MFAERINQLEYFLQFNTPGSIHKNADAFLASIESNSYANGTGILVLEPGSITVGTSCFQPFVLICQGCHN